jgi:hypothetical protein
MNAEKNFAFQVHHSGPGKGSFRPDVCHSGRSEESKNIVAGEFGDGFFATPFIPIGSNAQEVGPSWMSLGVGAALHRDSETRHAFRRGIKPLLHFSFQSPKLVPGIFIRGDSGNRRFISVL